jgi:hypothetical protein
MKDAEFLSEQAPHSIFLSMDPSKRHNSIDKV